MSVMVVEVLDCGIIFATDRNITSYYKDGTTKQSQENKVIKWSRENRLIGYVGEAEIEGTSTIEWLKSYVDEINSNSTLETISKRVSEELTAIWERQNKGSPLLIHLAGFIEKNGVYIPSVWFIRNVYDMGIFDYKDFRKEFICSDEFINIYSNRFKGQFKERKIYDEEIRGILNVWAKQLSPFWFHHGLDLATFNVLQGNMDAAFKTLAFNHPKHKVPEKLEEWEKYLRFQILMYGAYFEAFYGEGNKFVGGERIESITWPG